MITKMRFRFKRDSNPPGLRRQLEKIATNRCEDEKGMLIQLIHFRRFLESRMLKNVHPAERYSHAAKAGKTLYKVEAVAVLD
jgi:hypothetical protein